MSKKETINTYADAMKNCLLAKNLFVCGSTEYKSGGGNSRQISDDETPEFGKEGQCATENVGSVGSTYPTNCGDIPMRNYLRGKNYFNPDTQYDITYLESNK